MVYFMTAVYHTEVVRRRGMRGRQHASSANINTENELFCSLQ